MIVFALISSIIMSIFGFFILFSEIIYWRKRLKTYDFLEWIAKRIICGLVLVLSGIILGSIGSYQSKEAKEELKELFLK